MWVKICGVRTIEAALQAEASGADAIGINLHPPSPRYVDPKMASKIRESVTIPTYIVVVDRPIHELRTLMMEIEPYGIQFHGERSEAEALETGWPFIKAYRAHPGSLEELNQDSELPVLLDAFHPTLHGGTGKRVDSDLAREACRLRRVILAGGLTPENVAQILRQIPAWGVDVASGVEGPSGTQDMSRIQAFCQAAKQAGVPDSK